MQRSQTDLETRNRLRRNVADSARLPAAVTVEAAMQAVMCALTERLSAGEAHVVLESVPEAIAPMFDLCVIHRQGKPTARVDHAEFLAKVASHLGVTPAHAELVCSAVFNAVRAELPAEVVIAVAAQLPHGLKELWLRPPIVAPDLDVDLSPEDTRREIERDVERRAKLPPHVTAAAAFAAVMCCFARRLSGGEARHVLIDLPPVVRDIVERCVVHRGEHAVVFGRDELIRQVSDHLIVSADDAERITLEVLRAARRALPQLTSVEVSSQLPEDLRELWYDALPSHTS